MAGWPHEVASYAHPKSLEKVENISNEKQTKKT